MCAYYRCNQLLNTNVSMNANICSSIITICREVVMQTRLKQYCHCSEVVFYTLNIVMCGSVDCFGFIYKNCCVHFNVLIMMTHIFKSIVVIHLEII